MSNATLLAITPGDTRDLIPWIDALAEAGLSDLLLRERHRDAADIQRVYDHATQRVARVWVHLHTASALRQTPERLHLPSGHRARDHASADVRFGVSAHSDQEIDQALADGASYVLFSPVYRPTSKPEDMRTPLGEEAYLRRAHGRPVWALGGLSPRRWRRLVTGGATGGAVLGDLFGQPSPHLAADRLRAYGLPVSSVSSEPTTKTSGS